MDELTIAVSIAIGAILAYVVVLLTRKIWYLETMNPRGHYELGREKKIIVNMTINKRPFNGIEAGKYKLVLLYGDVATFSKPVLRGKIEQMYMAVLAESLVSRKLVTRIEKMRFFQFIFRRIPALTTKAYILTAELISPQDVLDFCWSGEERDKALAEMRKRQLIDPKILWVKPYPPEAKLKDIMSGVLMVPDLELEHIEDYARLTGTQRQTLIKINEGITILLKEVIPLERDIITSISDPFQVVGMIMTDRARKLEGLGLEQLAEKGGFPSVIRTARVIREHWKEFQKIFEEPPKREELEKVEERMKEYREIKSRLEKIEAQLEKPKAVAP